MGLIMHQTDVPINIQVSFPLTPMSSSHISDRCIIFSLKVTFCTVSFYITYDGNLLPFAVKHRMTVKSKIFVACCFLLSLVFPFEIHCIIVSHV
jgi:hypothetical protein